MSTSSLPPVTPALMPTYARQPVAFVRGEGVWLWDTDGKRYLDFGAGIKAKTNVAIWRTRGEHRPLIGEFAFQIRFQDRKQLALESMQRMEPPTWWHLKFLQNWVRKS